MLNAVKDLKILMFRDSSLLIQYDSFFLMNTPIYLGIKLFRGEFNEKQNGQF